MSLARMGIVYSSETKEKMSLAKKGKKRSGNPKKWKHSKETAEKLRRKMLGRKHSEVYRINQSNGQKKRIANGNHNFWKGGITEENLKLREGIEYRLWRESVFARDNWTCQRCGKRGGDLEAHHIKPVRLYPDLATSIENGTTLCPLCHSEVDKCRKIRIVLKK